MTNINAKYQCKTWTTNVNLKSKCKMQVSNQISMSNINVNKNIQVVLIDCKHKLCRLQASTSITNFNHKLQTQITSINFETPLGASSMQSMTHLSSHLELAWAPKGKNNMIMLEIKKLNCKRAWEETLGRRAAFLSIPRSFWLIEPVSAVLSAAFNQVGINVAWY